MSNYTWSKVKEEIIAPAFKELRKKGYIARMNYGCCVGCGSNDLHVQAGDRGKAGVIFWNRQHEEHQTESRKENGRLYINYSLHVEKGEEEPSAEAVADTVGNDLARELMKSIYRYQNKPEPKPNITANVNWDWDGNSSVELQWARQG